MKTLWAEHLSPEEERLLLELLWDQHYALELISSEINDIENGYKVVNEERYKKLIKLYERIRKIYM